VLDQFIQRLLDWGIASVRDVDSGEAVVILDEARHELDQFLRGQPVLLEAADRKSGLLWRALRSAAQNQGEQACRFLCLAIRTIVANFAKRWSVAGNAFSCGPME
jgi:hypothetical protein